MSDVRESVARAAEELRLQLGLKQPVSADAFARLFADAQALDRFSDPARSDAERRAQIQAAEASSLPVPREMMAGAVRIFWQWARTGFGIADPQTQAARLAACNACPRYIAAPEHLLIALAGMALADKRVCSHCGCFMAKKAAMAAGSCPEPDPAAPGLSRWQDPFPPATAATRSASQT